MVASGAALRGAWLTRGELVAVAIVWFVGAGTLAGVTLGAAAFDLDAERLLRDPANIAGTGNFDGALSHAGVLAWASGGVSALLAASLPSDGDRMQRFLLGIGLLSAVFCIDDLFRLHEMAGTALTGGNAGQTFVLGAYGVSGLALVWSFRAVVWTRTPVPLLLTVALLLGLSAAIDIGADVTGGSILGGYLLEDGPKFLGALLWAAYLVILARRHALLDAAGSGGDEHADHVRAVGLGK